MKKITFREKCIIGLLLCLMSYQESFALTFKFTYEAGYAWTEEQKSTIEAAGKFLAQYIADNQEVSITISSHGYDTEANTTEWVNNQKPIAKAGKISFYKSNQGVRLQVQTVIRSLQQCLGVFKSDKFKSYLEQKIYFKTITSFFKGPKTMALNGNKSIPLESNGLSVIAGFRDPLGISSLNDRNPDSHILSSLDLAMLSDIGYTIPILNNKATPFFFNLNLNNNFASTWKGYGELSGLGGNDTLIAGGGTVKSWVLSGLSGSDILVSADTPTEMYGDDLPLSMLAENNGKDIYYIKTNKLHTIFGMGENDSLFINPNLNITKELINSATLERETTTYRNKVVIKSKRFYGLTHYYYKLSIGGNTPLSLIFCEEAVDQLNGRYTQAEIDTAQTNVENNTKAKLLERIKKNTVIKKPSGSSF